MVGRVEGVYGESAVMLAAGGRILAFTVDVGVVALKEWYSGSFSYYICWLYGGF